MGVLLFHRLGQEKKESMPMKRIVNVNASSKPNWGKRACTVFVLCATMAIALPAQTFTTLHSFDGKDGANPGALLVQGADGNLYGTASAGGANGTNDGTVFKITESGKLTTLYSFCAQTLCTDGANPRAGLVQAGNGDFYGTTYFGGASGLSGGTVFKITTSGKLTTLYSFCAQIGCADGADPSAGLVQAGNGDFYGTTFFGGHDYGTVFKITAAGMFTTLYSFCAQSACPDGNGPSGLLRGSDGNFYGTTINGGAHNPDCGLSYGCGTVFQITPSGTLTTLHSFCAQKGCADGGEPLAGLVQAADGDFYGTTDRGGDNGNGTVFKIAPGGALTSLYSFCSQSPCRDGAKPSAGLVQATNGGLYGTTTEGGALAGPHSYGFGTVFQITPSGTLTTLYNFCSQSECRDGGGPAAGLMQATNGDLYGTAEFGGANSACQAGCGTVFRLSRGTP
jgi:uncharacterized repeat protein (TIGR03803 family)